MRDISCVVFPKPGHAFFEQTVLQRKIGHTLFQIASLAAQVLHLVRSSSTRRIASQTTLAGLHEILGPSVIQAPGNAFLAAQLGNTVATTQAIEHDPDLVLDRKVSTGLAADVLDHLLGRQFGP